MAARRSAYFQYLKYAIGDAILFLESIREASKGSRRDWVEARLAWIGRRSHKLLGGDFDPSEEGITITADMRVDLAAERQARIQAVSPLVSRLSARESWLTCGTSCTKPCPRSLLA